jgi:hypothetical protein
MVPASRASLEQALAVHGLRLRGGWIPTAADDLPALPAGTRAAVVWMVGQVGSACWTAFSSSRFLSDGLHDPMDRWSQSIGDALAHDHGGVAVYPSDGPPYAPFQQWARRADPQLQASPLLLQLHPRWGLWHALRFALVLPAVDAADARQLAVAVAPPGADICRSCDGQPCLQACPVHAFTPGRYDVPACTEHLRRPAGGDCMQHGCLARRACPVAPQLRYEPVHAAFHMRAFAERH